MENLILTVVIYSLVIFIVLFIWILVLYFRLRRHEREITGMNRKLGALVQNFASNASTRNPRNYRHATAGRDPSEGDRGQLEDTENEGLIENLLKEDGGEISPAVHTPISEIEADPVAKRKVEPAAKSKADPADLKDKILEILNQFDQAIEFERFSKVLSQDSSFVNQPNLALDLIDRLKEEKKIEVRFLKGKPFIELKRA